MAVSWRHITVGGLAALYLGGTAFLAGVVSERVRFDRERLAMIRAREHRAREARARAIRIELEQAAARRTQDR
jgi:hypothetical protein